MGLSLNLNYLRFFTSVLAVMFTGSPHMLGFFLFLATVGYSLVIPFCANDYYSLIAHRCISHVPSTVLLVLASYNDKDLRFYFLIAGGIQYLTIWMNMYSNIFTKELRTSILGQKSPIFAEEIGWVLSDVIFI